MTHLSEDIRVRYLYQNIRREKTIISNFKILKMTAELSIVVPTIKLFAILCFCRDPYQHLSYISAYKYLEVIKTLNTKIFEIFDRRLYKLNIKRKTIILNLPARKFFASNPPTLLYAITG